MSKSTPASWKKGHVPWNVGKTYSNVPDGYWSRFFKCCVECGTTKTKHNAGGLCKNCYYRTDDQKKVQERQRIKTRNLALTTYGGKFPKCNCCGEIEVKFLAIDHIDGCGKELRKKQGSGSALYIWLRSNKYPPGYQVLCHNCNTAREAYGICPHKLK